MHFGDYGIIGKIKAFLKAIASNFQMLAIFVYVD